MSPGIVPTTEAALVLDQQTRDLLTAIETDPGAGAHIGVLAPGGYGKTTVLGEVAAAFRRAGVPVLDGRQGAAEPGGPDGGVLLVDDAHQLGEDRVRELRRIAETGRLRLAVALRPWPRSAALAELTDLLGWARTPLLPRPFDQAQTTAYLTAVWEAAPHRALAEFVHAQTGGVPRFVAWLADALAGTARGQQSGAGAQQAGAHQAGAQQAGTQPAGIQPSVPQAAIARFRYELERLGPDLQRFLLAAEAGLAPHLDLLGALLGRDADGVAEVMDAARATGLLGPDATLLPIARTAVRALIPLERQVAVRQRLAELQLERGGPLLGLARSLIRTGIGGASAAAAFEAAAEEALPAEPALSTELYAAASNAARPSPALLARWAHAAALSGDLNATLRLADQAINDGDTPDRAGARVAAAALAHRGQLGRSAELYRWAAPDNVLAMVGLVGTGQLAEARQLLAASTVDGPPTMLAGATALMAQGTYESVTESATAALSTLVRASALLEPTGQAVLLPDSPAALAALAAIHCGELTVAESVLARAVAANMGGALMAVRHRLLQAWILMLRGHTAQARERLGAARKSAKVLESRDWLFAVALDVGLARRDSDVAALHRIWHQVCEAVLRHPVDLFTLLPLGEFATAAARLRDQDRLAPHLQQAAELLERLGNPPLWTVALHWSRLHAAIIAEQPAVAEQHAAALAGVAEHGRYHAVLSAAAQSWLAVLAGRVDPERVESAARGLHAAGLAWDGARLAGQAAIRTADRKAMVGLLECARVLQGRPPGTRHSNTTATTPDQPPTTSPAKSNTSATGKLSDREREVASLVLDGLTYKQVADRLFISAKTVEHHVARMRQRLGATSRSELLAQLRELVHEPPTP